ncbi:MAG: PQQ-binding-like beta-propeller repeat protein [Planctomycetes bacterium]|nr:PQQ-binding-like beta-propeller repeat protein [Planctomycetota bacterium]
MKSLGIITIILFAGVSALAGLVEECGVQGGIVVQVGCGSSKELMALRASDKYLVHGLDRDESHISDVRESLRSEGLYGPISAAVYDGQHLPYTDNLINLLIVEESTSELPATEIMRVLVPGGIAVKGENRIQKPWPDTIDEWTHYLHGPDNNAVARDTVVAAPRTIQWVSHPKWARSHEEAASMSAMVSAQGRIFTIMDEALNVSIRYMPDWKLIARDAFNGTLLWKRTIPLWTDHLRHFRAGPTHLPRRLVAVGNRVYVTMGLDAPVSILDAVTGETLRTLKGTERTEEITVQDGIVYLVIGTSEIYRWGAGLHYRREPSATAFRYITALDSDSGEALWRKDFTGSEFLLPLTMTVRTGSLFYQTINGVGRLDARTGEPLWEKKRPTVARRMSFTSPTVVATDNVLLVADRVPSADSQDPKTMAATDKIEWGVNGWNEEGFARKSSTLLVAYDVQDGQVLWTQPCKESYNSPVDIFVVKEKVHIGSGWERFDLQTGQKDDMPDIKMASGKVGMPHHRCYRNKASVRYVFTGRSGIEVADMETGWQGNNSWIRGTCQYGIMPANGMLYAPPDACGCFNKVKVQGLFAAGPTREKTGTQLSDTERLFKGPAYGEDSGPEPPVSDDWPMYRHDRQRSGAVKTTVPNALKKAWSAQLTGRLTQAVTQGNTVYVAETDTHTVYALDAERGTIKWCFTADGRIDSAPTIYRGMVLFGAADGCVYNVRARDGKLVWRFHAAPQRRLVSSYGQLESVWPVHGSVLVQDNTLYTSAGRNTYLDDGITLYRLDPMTGKVLLKNLITNFDPETGDQLGAEAAFDMEGVNTDILSSDGETLFMKQMCFDASLQRTHKIIPHLFGVHGFLGEEWFVRSYWLLGTDVRAGWGGWASGDETTFGRIMTFDDKTAYGYGRVKIASAAVGHQADDYHLFGVKKVLMQTGLRKARNRNRNKLTKPEANVQKKPVPFWADTQSLIVRAMVLTQDKLVVAGPPDLRQKESDILAYKNDKEALANFMGEKGVFLRVLSAKDGQVLSEGPLDAMPVFDGMSAAQGRIFVSLKNGQLQCWK